MVVVFAREKWHSILLPLIHTHTRLRVSTAKNIFRSSHIELAPPSACTPAETIFVFRFSAPSFEKKTTHNKNKTQDVIYTNVADVLISINPYKNIPLLYEVPLQQMQDEPGDEFEESDGEREASRVESIRCDAIPREKCQQLC